MKILMIAPQPFYTERGTPIAIDLILQILSERGEDVDLVTFHIGKDVSYEHVNIYRLPKLPFPRNIPPGFSWRKAFLDFLLMVKVFSLLIKKRYDFVHAVEESVFIALIIKAIFKIPYVYDMDSNMVQQMMERYPRLFFPFRSLFEALEGIAVRHAKVVIPVCEALHQDIQKHQPKNVIVLWDISLLEKNGQINTIKLRDKLDIEGSLFMYVGNLEPYQGVDLLLESFAIYLREGKGSLVIIGGKDVDIQKYIEKAKHLGIEKYVFFMGPKPVEHLFNYLANADILVSPRIKGKNTPMKIYSYLGSGKAVLATNLDTHTQVIDRQVAELAEPNPDAFAAGMLRLAQDERLRFQLGQAGKKLVEERHSFQVFREKVNALYDWLKLDILRDRQLTPRPAARSIHDIGRRDLVPEELRIYYQPIVSLESNQIIGFEALVRWQHPDFGLLTPSEFMGMAEATGQIIPMGRWVLHEACRQMQAWNLQYPSIIPLTICVNLSAKQLMQPDLFEQIDQVLEETGLDTQSLILEVSDRAIAETAGAANDTVLQLKARGVQIHLDYFEAGESSLKIMRDLQLDTIKIEPAHTRQFEDGRDISSNIQKAIQQARQSGVDLVAVGVENKEQLERIKALRFSYGQGYLFSEPLDVDEVELLISSPQEGKKLSKKNLLSFRMNSV